MASSSSSSLALEALEDCAEAIEAGDLRLADSRLDRVLTLAAQQPNQYQRKVVKYFAEALVRRAYGLQHPAATNFSLHLSPPLGWIYCWCPGLIYSVRSGIEKEVMGKKRFHLIDFYIPHGYGEDYLFRLLPNSCKNNRLSVRVSVVLPPCLEKFVNFERENKYLTEAAERSKDVELEMKDLKVVYANSLSELGGDSSTLELTRREDEGVLVFYCYKLQRMLGEGAILEREFMKLREINPDIIIIREQSADLNHSNYIKRFKDSFHYYSLAFKSYRYIPAIHHYYRRQIGNIVGCEGSDRIVRPQTLDRWTSCLADAHFSQLPLKLGPMEYVTVYYKENNGCLVINSDDHNHALGFISAWKASDLEQHLIPTRLNLSNPIGSNQNHPRPSQLYLEGLSLNGLAVLAEIYDIEEDICHKYDLSCTLTWVYKPVKRIYDKAMSEYVLSILHDYIYESNHHFVSVRERLSSKKNLSEKQSVVEKVLQSNMPFHFEPKYRKSHAVVTICLQNHFDDEVYVADFIWPSSKRTSKELDSLALDIFNYLKNMTKKFVRLRINGTEDGFQEPISITPQEIEPRDTRDVLETRELNQQGCEKQSSFEPLLSNSNEVVKDEGDSQIQSVKRRRLRSDVWGHFYKEEREVGKQRAVCKYCHKEFDGSSKKGTTHLKNHFQRCKRVSTNVRDAQLVPVKRTKSVGEGNSSFDQDRSNLDVARMIIKHQSLEPLTSDILCVYKEEKLKLLEHFDKLSCRFNVTINLWVHEVEKTTYCCYVVLFIDDDWELKKKVVALKRLGQEFDAKIIHESFKGVVEDWNFDKKVCSLTIQGSSSCFEIVEEIRKTWLPFEISHPLSPFYISGHECMIAVLGKDNTSDRDFNMLMNVGKSIDTVAGTSNPCLVGIHDMYKGLGQNGIKGYPLMDVKTDDHNLRTLSLVLAMQTIFDPRFKSKFVEFSYKSIYGKHVAKTHLRIIDDALTDIFNEYGSSTKDDVNSSISLNEDTIESFHKWCNFEKTDELNTYLKEPKVSTTIEFHLHSWWREQASSFTTLGRMARDILAIPVSSIISGYVLREKSMMDNPIFNGLDPEIIEAMICSKDWLESPKECCPIVKTKNISTVKEAPVNDDLGKEAIIWTEEEIRAYLVSPFTSIESEHLKKLQNDARIGVCVGGVNIKDQSLAALLMIPPPGIVLRDPRSYYIDDVVVNQFFILLKKRYERFPHKYLKHHSFDSAIATLLINGSNTESQVLKGLNKEDLKDSSKLFLPMCLYEHWILFYADVDSKRLVWLDSLEQTRMSNDWEKCVIQRWFSEFVLPSLGHDDKDWSFYVPHYIPSQKNSVDCAVFVMKYADCLTHGNCLPFTQDDMPHFRLRTLLDLYRGSTCLGMGQSC